LAGWHQLIRGDRTIGSRPWRELLFPGATPKGRGEPIAPQWSTKVLAARHHSPAELVRVALRDFLAEAGYEEFDDAISDVIRALEAETSG